MADGMRKIYDPLAASSIESDAFNRAWLKDGKRLKPIQRVGFGIFSLAFIFAGLVAGGFCYFSFDSGIFAFLLSGAISLFTLVLGGMGFRNVLRFKSDDNI
jgi:hypothetical protein